MAIRRHSDNSVSQRRRAIYKGLSQYLTGDDLLNAMCIWQQEYSRLPKFAITHFVRRVTEHTDLAKARAAIHLNLTSALMLDEDSLGPDPLQEMRSYLGKRVGAVKAEAMLGGSTPTLVSSGPQADCIMVFEYLLDGFLKRIAVSSAGSEKQLRTHLSHNLADMSMSPENQASLMLWLQGTNPHIEVMLEVTEMQQIMHASYVAACKQLGPVKADRLLTEALMAAETSEAGQRYSPRELL